uniref:deleted in malignant brain tumors 1 protein-like n=1 Tax=Styela clava TaxID=7725 RepID=UPI00193A314A|nr:deleted in malignant brain tumors 1 protein-like [Styela clava]
MISDIRLANGNHDNEGRIEVKINDVWGDICSNDWDIDDARVVCRMLGFDGAVEHFNDPEYGRGDGPVWMNRVQCSGREEHLSDCIFQGIPIYDCDETDDIAGVECISNDPQEEVKLEFGAQSNEGTVFIKRDGIWGTICDDNWSIEAANVVCHMLGFERAYAAHTHAYYGEGEGQIWLEDVTCRIDEWHISRCEHDMWGDHNCEHDEDAGVHCLREGEACVSNDDCGNDGTCGITSGECGCAAGFCGKSCNEIDCATIDCVNGKLFDGFSSAECRCTGNFGLDEDGLCTVEGESKCDPPCTEGLGYCLLQEHTDSVYSCDCIEGVDDCTEESDDIVRIVDGVADHQGRVEIYHDDEWRAICDDLWDLEDAHVICRMLDYSGAVAAVHDAHFGKCGCGYWLDDVRCNGHEAHISDCVHRPWGNHNCGSSEAASVICEMPCDSGPCKNKAKCRNLNKEEYECTCTPSFKGPTCEIPC